jgi:hypothetical protein
VEKRAGNFNLSLYCPVDEEDDDEPAPKVTKRGRPAGSKNKKPAPEPEEDEDDDDDDEEESPKAKPSSHKTSKTSGGKSTDTGKGNKGGKCPAGGVFGKDCDTLEACEKCSKWEECDEAGTK